MALHPSATILGLVGELHEDAVCLFDDVVVGDDIAAWVDDEAGAEGLTLAARTVLVISTAAAAGVLPAEKAVEEILHIALVRLVLIVAAGRGPSITARTGNGGFAGNGFDVDFDNGGANLLDDGGEAIRKRHGARNDDGAGVGRVDVLLLGGADGMGEDGAAQNAGGKRSQQDKSGGKSMSAEALKQSV